MNEISYFWKIKSIETLGHAYAYTCMRTHTQALSAHTQALRTHASCMRMHTCRGRATLSLGGAVAPAKKKKYPLEVVRKLIGPPYVGYLAPSYLHHSPS